MDLRVSSLFMAAYLAALVNSWCFHVNPKTVNFDALCSEWWDKATRYTKDSSIRRCVKIITSKCPCKIMVETEIRRPYDGESRRYKNRMERMMATLSANPETWVKFKDYKDSPICSEENVKVDCDHWWSVARNSETDDNDKELCINRILQHCKGKITKLEETSICRVRGWRTTYDLKKVKYQYKKGDTATFKRYDPVN